MCVCVCVCVCVWQSRQIKLSLNLLRLVYFFSYFLRKILDSCCFEYFCFIPFFPIASMLICLLPSCQPKQIKEASVRATFK